MIQTKGGWEGSERFATVGSCAEIKQKKNSQGADSKTVRNVKKYSEKINQLKGGTKIQKTKLSFQDGTLHG